MKRFLLSLLVAMMAVVPAMSQLTETLHEGFEGGVLPAGWTQEFVQRPAAIGVDEAECSWTVETGNLQHPDGAAEGTHRIAARNASTDEMHFVTRLVSPVMNVSTLFRPQVSFWHAEPTYTSWSDTLRMYYRTSANDIWHLYDKCVYTRTRNWKKETIDLIAPNRTYQLAFEITENMGYGVMLDDIVVAPTPTCRLVTDIQAVNVHAFDVTLIWNEEGYFDHFDVLVANQPVADLTNIPDSVVVVRNQEVYNTELPVENLAAETTYYVYVRSDCQENVSGYTDWVMGEFRTLSVVYLPYTQNFNAFDRFQGQVNYGLPHGWMVGSTRNVVAPFVRNLSSRADNASFSIDSTAHLCFNGAQDNSSTPLAQGAFAYAVTPEVIEPSLQGLEVAFWATAYNKVSVGDDAYAASLMVGVMTDPTDFATFEVIDTVTIESGYQFKRFNVSLADYTGTAKYVALASRFDKQNAVYVDNVTLTRPATMVPTIWLTGTNSTGFQVHADIAGADSWNLKISTAYDRNGNVADSTVLYTETSLTGALHTVSVNKLFRGQTVMVYAQAVKNGVASAWSFPVTVRVPDVMTLPYLNSCEVASGQVAINTLNHEIRLSSPQQVMASVYFPIGGISADIRNHPVLESVKPNYRGAHARLEGVDSWFTLPELDDMTNLRMVLRYATVKDMKGKVEIGVMTDPYDLTTFEHLMTISSNSTEYHRALVDLDAYTGAGKYIAFRSLNAGVANLGSVMLLDEILVEPWGDCREAANVEAVVNSTEATINWAMGGMSQWVVRLSTKRSMLNATEWTVDTSTITFHDLTPETQYYYTIQTQCGDSLLDLDNVFYEFRTPRGLPFEEKFANYAMPTGWTMATGRLNTVLNGTQLTTATSGWSVSSTYTNTPQTGYSAYAEVYGTSCNKWLISPVLEMPETAEALELSFDVSLTGDEGDYYYGTPGSTQPGTTDKFAVLLSMDGGRTWSRQNATIWSNDGQCDFMMDDLGWEVGTNISIDASACIGNSICIAFYVESTVNDEDYYLSVDNINLHVFDSRCGNVSSLQATTNGLINWTLGGVNPYPALVQVSKSQTFSSILSTDTVAGTSLQLNDLESSTRYYVRVRQLCQQVTEWISTSFSTPCDAVSIADFGTENFSRPAVMDCWNVGFMSNNGSGSLPARASDDRLGQYLRIAKTTTTETSSDGAFAISPELDIPDSLNHYQVVFRAGTTDADAKNVGRVKVGIVTDPNDPSYTFVEQATIQLSPAADSMELKTYVVSFADYLGDNDDYYGRHIMFLSQAGADSTNYVYIDDVMFEPASACRMVLNLAVDTTTEESVSYVWDGTADKYELMLTNSFAQADTVTQWVYREIVTGNDALIEDLLPNTNYYAYIRSICGEDTTRWSSPSRATTRFGIFFEPWDDKESVAAAGWTQSSTRLRNSVMSNLTLGSSKYSLTTSMTNSSSNLTVTGMSGKIARANIYSSDQYAWLITPSIDMTKVESGAQLSFKLAVYPYNSSVVSESINKRFAVIVSEDNGATWNPANGIYWTCDGNGDYDFRTLSANAQKVRMDLSQYVGKRIKLGFYGESTSIESGQTSTDLYFAMDSIGVSKYIAECLGVRNLTMEMISDDEAKATWRNISIPEIVNIDLALDPNFTTIVASETNYEGTEYTFSDLLPNRKYYVRVAQVGCEVEPAVASVSTPKSIPYTEKLELIPNEWVAMKGNVTDAFNGTLPVEGNASAWTIADGSAAMAGKHLLGELYKQATITDSWLVSPEVVLNAAENDTVLLSFDLNITQHGKTAAPASAAATDGQEFRVLLSTDGGDSWSENDQWLFANTSDAHMALSAINTLTHIELNLNEYKNERVRVALYKASTHAKNDNDLHIQNFRIGKKLQPCDMPTALTASEVSFSTATISWESDVETTVVEYASLADFSDAQSVTVTDGNSLALSTLKASTHYYVRIKSVCSEESESDWTASIDFSTSRGLPYEDALADRGDWAAYQTDLAVDLSTPTWTPVTSNLKGWRKNTNAGILSVAQKISCAHTTATHWFVSPEIDLTPNVNEVVIAMSMDLALTSGFSKTTAPTAAAVAGKHFYVMISADNGVTWSDTARWEFSDDADANYLLKNVPAGVGKNYEFDITRFGGKKIRVALVLEGASSAAALAMHAANFNLYNLSSNCFGVGEIIVNDVDTAAHVSLTTLDGASQWQVAYGLRGAAVENMKRVDSFTKDSVELGGLLLNSTYDVYARSICAAEDTSAWTGPVQMVTPLGLTYTAPMRGTLNDWELYTGDLDSVAAGRDTLTTATSGWQTTTTTNALGEAHVYATKDTKVTNWLVSPVINLKPQHDTESSIYLSWDMALTGSSTSSLAPTSTAGQRFAIAVSEDKGATWTADNMIVFNGDSAGNLLSEIPAGAGRTYHFDVTKYAGKEIRMALVMCAAAKGSSAIHVNDLELALYDAPCFGPAALSAEYKQGVAQCVLTPGDEATTWQYVYGTHGFNPSNGNAVTITSPKFAIDNIPMSSTVDIYVRSICSNADTSAWFGPAQVTTPLGIPYAEPLNESTRPADWGIYTYSTTTGKFTASTSGWYVGSGKNTYVWSANHAYINAYSTNKYMLASPAIDLGRVGGKAIMLSFEMALTKYNQTVAPTSVAGQTFEVRVSLDGGTTWEAEPVATWGDVATADYDYSAIPTTGETYMVDMSEYGGETVRFGFFSSSTGTGCDNDVHIRNVVLDTLSGSLCMPVKRVQQLEEDFTTVKVAFRAPGIQDALSIDYVCLPENSIFNERLAHQVKDTNVVVIKGLTSSMNYDLFARVTCQDSALTEWTGPFSVHTAECTPITGISYTVTEGLDGAEISLNTTNAASASYQLVLTEHNGAIDEAQAQSSKTNRFVLGYAFKSSSIYDVYARKICVEGDTADWSGPFLLKTPVVLSGATIFSEDMNKASIPTGWEHYSVSSSVIPTPDNAFVTATSSWSVGSTKNSEAFQVNHAYVNIWSTNKKMFATPVIDLSAVTTTGAVLVFDMALTDYGNANEPEGVAGQRFEIRVSTDYGVTWQLVEAWAENGAENVFGAIPTGDGETYMVNLSEYVGEEVMIGFYSCATTSGADNDLHIRNVMVAEAGDPSSDATCQKIEQISIDDIQLHSATVTFGHAVHGYYELATDSRFTNVVDADSVQGTSLALNNLSASTTYYFHVKNVCSQDNESRYSNPLRFATSYGTRFYEPFDEDVISSGKWQKKSGLISDVFDHGQSGFSSASSTYGPWNYTNDVRNIGTSHVRSNLYNSTCHEWIISPEIDLTPNAGQSLLLAFDVATSTFGNGMSEAATSTDDRFVVAVSTDGGRSWNENNAFVWDCDTVPHAINYQGNFNTDLTATPQRKMIDMSQFAGQHIKIGFYTESTMSGTDIYLYLDNVELNATESFVYEDTICSSSDYENYGISLAAKSQEPGLHRITRISAEMDSVIYLDLFVKPSYELHLKDTICEGEIYNENGYNFVATVSGVQRRRLESSIGCDSIVLLDLTVNPIEQTEYEIFACYGTSVEYKGKTYYSSTVVVDTTQTFENGCDSIVTTYILFSDPTHSATQIDVVLCPGESYMVGDTTITTQGHYTISVPSEQGCDSTVILHLLTVDASGNIYDTVRVEDLPYIFGDRELVGVNKGAGTYDFSHIRTNCNTDANIHVTVVDSVEGYDNLFDGKHRIYKRIIDNKLYIFVEDRMYDATGKAVR